MHAHDIDIDHLREWIGNGESRSDIVTEGLVERFRATLGPTCHRGRDDAAPLAIHWCLAPTAVSEAGTGPDGHPARGGFLPPVPLPRRMWAGGALECLDDIRIGDHVTRNSTIADVALKEGQTGRLVFVTVEHSIETGRGVAVRERQDIVYREPQKQQPAAPSAAPANPYRRPEHSESVEATSLLLFRYSALTFNGHRIHYDKDYARREEGYRGLVVHGPMQATMLLHLGARLADGRQPRSFTYRGLSPLFDGTTFTLNALPSGNGFDLWCADAEGRETMAAKAELG